MKMNKSLVRINKFYKSRKDNLIPWESVLSILQLIGFYDGTLFSNSSFKRWKIWKIIQISVFIFQSSMAIILLIGFIKYSNPAMVTLFVVVNEIAMILSIVSGIMYQIIILYNSRDLTKLALNLKKVSISISANIDTSTNSLLLMAIFIAISAPILTTMENIYTTKDYSASGYFMDPQLSFKTFPKFYYIFSVAVKSNPNPSLYLFIFTIQVINEFFQIFCLLMVDIFIYKIIQSYIILYRKSQDNLRMILKNSKIVDSESLKIWSRNHNKIKTLTLEGGRLLAPLILAFSLSVPLLIGIDFYFIQQTKHNLPFIKSWQAKIVTILIALLHTGRLFVLTLQGQKFIDTSNGLTTVFSESKNCKLTNDAEFEVEEYLIAEKYFPVYFSAYEFFSLSKNFLTTVFGSIFTYLIILVQLTADPCWLPKKENQAK
ncbi:uncharacterized protein [Parasteatoda tepidariorum]|uniref:uncharacterized protein n=1 Tax=Parasteatoda tepidariorum TaxID=114398 RepID=UPI0039BD8899